MKPQKKRSSSKNKILNDSIEKKIREVFLFLKEKVFREGFSWKEILLLKFSRVDWRDGEHTNS
ncbi:hypothetical protein LEP1GSC060_0121 [Leptospira weilii serovar Ranarum str. ICFT]|uniref:Uncharacterized protein n=1 Tax=Leptospira weilii serovar Ranarum str. ICFT TaxID=1218598 RepID=N1WP00_9LEPT|nr:hypothetical protein LEP1GSC060_0121 [Leptospira weilii serovar Ranarum str. ICFT]